MEHEQLVITCTFLVSPLNQCLAGVNSLWRYLLLVAPALSPVTGTTVEDTHRGRNIREVIAHPRPWGSLGLSGRTSSLKRGQRRTPGLERTYQKRNVTNLIFEFSKVLYTFNIL